MKIYVTIDNLEKHYADTDDAGYWFTFELKNDSRRQTCAVRHTDLL